MNLNRAPRWDKHRPQFLQVGLAIAIALAFMAFNYTSYGPKADDVVIFEPEANTEIEVTPPIMRDRKPLPQPPAPKLDIVDIIEPDVEPEFIEDKLPDLPVEPTTETSTEKAITEDVVSHAPPVLPLPVDEAEEDEIVVFAERMPVYNTCDLELSEAEKRRCTQGALLEHIYSKLRYPSIARENNIHGTVVVGFVIDKSGQVTATEILKDIGGGCGKEVLRVIGQLGDFHPGKQNGRPVSVMYRVPVKFELQG